MPEKMLSEVIDTAIQREQDAYFFYRDIMDLVQDAQVKDTLEWIANEEIKHRKFLVDYRNGKFGATALRMTQAVSYKIAEHLDEPEISKEMKSEDVYLTAAHREMKSHAFYSELAKLHEGSEIGDILIRMANEELKHKEKVEYLYSNTAFPQTSGG
ncbi:MAG: ferritin family protein [Proteobacteria bacterium]|nr:ferritin family protein [Pseudomonadota bacterium]MBU4472273.1 ferritin family protein [Pseudomonadota bacterium]MCG2751968.1 ferritin family protein [Desulfobacteraceae bacterium]